MKRSRAWIGLALAAAYALPYGPAARYAGSRPAYEVVWFDIVYGPVLWLRSYESIRIATDWYCNLWT